MNNDDVLTLSQSISAISAALSTDIPVSKESRDALNEAIQACAWHITEGLRPISPS